MILTINVLSELTFFEDQYTCVPVPNTMYYMGCVWMINSQKAVYQGSCLLSTIHNLLNILCRDGTNDTKRETWKQMSKVREDIKTYFGKEELYYNIPGMTSPANLIKFAEKIGLVNIGTYQPTIYLLANTLNSLLIDNEKLPIISREMEIEEMRNFINSILNKITGHNLVVKLGKIITGKTSSFQEASQERPLAKIKIKNEDFIYKRITIILNDGTKYVMNSAKKVKGANYHQENLYKFIEIYK